MSGFFEVGFFFSNLARFWPTFLIELAVIVLAAYRAKSGSPRLGALGRRLTAGQSDASGLWCLPFYVWAWQANLLVCGLFSDWESLNDTARIYDEMEAIFASLFHLLAFQTIGTMITDNAPATLGLIGHPRTAVTAAILSVFLGMGLFFWILG